MKALDLAGNQYGRLLVTSRAEPNGKRTRWRCLCSCGKETVVYTSKLTMGHTKSCGCLMVERLSAAKKTHGHTAGEGRSLTYKTYTNMVTRCENPRANRYHLYGGIGIAICDRWRHGENGQSGFECFLSDMGDRPSVKHSIDRIDNRRGYEPGNCRWALPRPQVLNRSSTIMVVVGGYEVPLTVACDLSGIKYGTAWNRLRRGQVWHGGKLDVS